MPNMVSLPAWFWIIYYGFYLLTFSISMISIAKKRKRMLSIINLIILITIPFISFINGTGRIGTNEFQHLIMHLSRASLWSIYVLVGYLFIFIWWILFLKNKLPKFKRE